MFLLPKLNLIFSIIFAFGKMQYKFKNGTILKMPKKFVIVATFLLVYYLIIRVNYI